MKISAKAEYACLAVLALARQGPESSPLHIREISEAYGIPERYLVQILLQLKGAGLVASTRGVAGGYRLARAATDISLSEVLVAVDGPDVPRRIPARPSVRRPRCSPRSGKASARRNASFSTTRRSLNLPNSPRPMSGSSDSTTSGQNLSTDDGFETKRSPAITSTTPTKAATPTNPSASVGLNPPFGGPLIRPFRQCQTERPK